MALGIALGSALLMALVIGASRSVGHNFWPIDKIEQKDKAEQADEKSSSDKSDQKEGPAQMHERSSKKAPTRKTNL